MSSNELVLEVGKFYTVRDPKYKDIRRVRIDAIREDIDDPDHRVAATIFYGDGRTTSSTYALGGRWMSDRLSEPSDLVAEYDPTALTDKDVEYQELMDKVLLLETQVRDLGKRLSELQGTKCIPASTPIRLGSEHVGMRVRLRSGEIATICRYNPFKLTHPILLRIVGSDIDKTVDTRGYVLSPSAEDDCDVVEILD